MHDDGLDLEALLSGPVMGTGMAGDKIGGHGILRVV